VLRHHAPAVPRPPTKTTAAVLVALAFGVALAACGSRDVADYPPAPGPPAAPPLRANAEIPGRGEAARVRPAARPVTGAPVSVDRDRSTVTAGGRSAPAPLAPVAVAATPTRVYVVGGRERTVAAYDRATLRELARVPAGAGPTHLVADDEHVFVADTTGRALLVFAAEPELRLVHRGALPGAPWVLALDERRDRLWVTIPGRNRVLAFRNERRPERLQGFDTVRQPDALSVGARVTVRGAEETQVIDPERD